MQGRERDDHLSRAAIGAGDDSLVRCHCVGIDLGHDQRHFGVHSPIAALVNDHGALIDGPRSKLGRHLIRRTGDHQIDICEYAGLKRFDRQLFVAEDHLTARRTFGSQQFQTLMRKLALCQLFQYDAADSSTRTD